MRPSLGRRHFSHAQRPSGALRDVLSPVPRPRPALSCRGPLPLAADFPGTLRVGRRGPAGARGAGPGPARPRGAASPRPERRAVPPPALPSCSAPQVASVASSPSLQAKCGCHARRAAPRPGSQPPGAPALAPNSRPGDAAVRAGAEGRPATGGGAGRVHSSRQTSLGIKVINFPLSRAGTQTEIKSA